MKAMILAAGYGTRLTPITDNLPKPLVPVLNIPIIDYTLFQLYKANVQKIVINLHHHAVQIRDYSTTWNKKLNLTFLMEETILGTGGGIKNAQPLLKEEPFLLINADILFNLDLTALYQHHLDTGLIATMVLRPMDASQINNLSSIELSKQNKILKINPPQAEPSNSLPLHFACIHVISPAFFDLLPTPGFSSIVNDGYLPLLKDKQSVEGFLYDGFWSDIGQFPDLYQTNMKLLTKPNIVPFYKELSVLINENSTYEQQALEKTRLIMNNILIGNNCSIHPTVQLEDNCIIGNSVQIDENTHLSNVLILPGSHIPADKKIMNAIVYPNKTFGCTISAVKYLQAIPPCKDNNNL